VVLARCFSVPITLTVLALAASSVSAAGVKNSTDDNEPVQYVLVYTGFDVASHGSMLGYVEGQFAPFGGLEESGVRFWLAGGRGTYKYPADSSTIRGDHWTGSALFGGEIESEIGSWGYYAGLNVQNHQLSAPDPDNRVQGTAVGVELRSDIWMNPTAQTLFYIEASYSTAFQTYHATAKVGYDIFAITGNANGRQIFFGPQVTFAGDGRSDERRLGAHLTTANWGKVNFEISAGYQYDRDNGSGVYGVIEMNTKF
jgi:hypothetical protein